MSNVRKTLQMTSLLFGMAILFCYIAWSLGYEGFIIVGHVNLPTWSWYVIPPIFLCINLSLQTGYILDRYSWKVLNYSIPLSLISAVGAIWFPYEIFTGPIPMIVLTLGIIYNKLEKRAFIRLLVINGATIVWQWATSKFSQIVLSASNISMYQVLRLSISMIILNLLFYSIGGVKHARFRLEHMVFPGFLRNDSENNSIVSQSVDDISLSTFEKWMVRSVVGVAQVIQWMFILWVCSLDNLFLDALVMTTSFICHGKIISKRQHLKPVILCTLAATAMFYAAARFTISFQYSQFFPIVIGLILTYTLYRISYQFELAAKKKAEEELERILILEKRIDAAWQRLDDLS